MFIHHKAAVYPGEIHKKFMNLLEVYRLVDMTTKFYGKARNSFVRPMFDIHLQLHRVFSLLVPRLLTFGCFGSL